MAMSIEEIKNRRDDNGDYYVNIMVSNGVFRLAKPRTIHDVIDAARKFLGATHDTSLEGKELEVKHKGFIVVGSIEHLGLPRGAMLEVLPAKKPLIG